MAIIIKFIFRSIREKKFRTFLILFSVALSTALFFASIALAGTMEYTFMQRIKKYIGTADIVIHPNEKSPSWLFHTFKAENYPDRFDYVVGSVETSGIYKNRTKTVTIDLKGFHIDELQVMNPYVLASEWNLQPFEGKKIILSKKLAEDYHFQIGQNIEITINQSRYRFRIVGIAQPFGMFQEDGRSNTALVPRDTLSRLFNGAGKVSLIYIKSKDPHLTPDNIAVLSKEYRRYTVREPISKEELRHYTESVSTPFLIMVVLVLCMSIFIIYSSFKVITRERLPVIGTFRSIGASRKTTDFVMFAESVFYGTVGGIIGCALGIVILYVMSDLTKPEWLAGVKTEIRFSSVHLLCSFGLAVLLPVISSVMPILQTSKIPVKDVILNTIEKPKKKRKFRLIAGFVCLAFTLTVPHFAAKEWALLLNVGSLVLAVVSTILLVPFLTSAFLKCFEVIYEHLLGNEGVLAAKNSRENKGILNNISLLAIGISSLLMINTVNHSVLKEVANFFRDATFQIWMEYYHTDRRFEGVLKSIKGVSNVYSVYEVNGVEIDGSKDKINLVHGIKTHRHLEFWNLECDGDWETILRKLDDSRTILLANILRDKLGVKLGDRLTLKMARGKRTYKVIGFFNSMMWGGSYALVADRFLKTDMQLHYYNNIFIKTDEDPKTVMTRINKKFERYRPWLQTMQEMSERDLKSNQQMFLILQGFSIMTLIIGVFGVFNNLIISFIERKRSFAMMRSVGLSKRQSLKMIFIEAFTGGMLGGIVGIITGTILLSLLPSLLHAIDKIVIIHYSIKEYFIAFIAGVFITVIASVSPAIKSSKINIIEAIKYE